MMYAQGKFALFLLDEIGTITDAKIGRMIECSDKRKRKSMFNEIKQLLPKIYAADSDTLPVLTSIATGCDPVGNNVVVACYEFRSKTQRGGDADVTKSE